MIEIPTDPAPNGISPALIDYSITQRPATGGAVQRITRPGSRFRMEVTFPPMKGEKSRVFIARLLRGKREGAVRMRFPLLDIDQGTPGAPIIDGAGQAGTSVKFRGLRPGYLFKEGFWLAISDPTGQPYLHNVTAPVYAGSDGRAIVEIEPPLRFPFPDAAAVSLAPMVEGFIDGGEWGWSVATARIYGISFVLEEAG